MGRRLQKAKEFLPEGSYWTFIRETTQRCAIYKCRCGVEKELRMVSPRNGQSLSCGCFSRLSTKLRATKHGYHSHPVYRIWAHIMSRCYNTKAKEYHNYGGRGVMVCEEWKTNPKSFVEWALNNGWQKGLDIDKDILAKKLGNEPLLYSPERCVFVTRKVNLSERRTSVKIEYNGEVKTLAEWDDLLKFPKGTVRSRIFKYKWDISKAMTNPIKKISK